MTPERMKELRAQQTWARVWDGDLALELHRDLAEALDALEAATERAEEAERKRDYYDEEACNLEAALRHAEKRAEKAEAECERLRLALHWWAEQAEGGAGKWGTEALCQEREDSGERGRPGVP